MKRNAKNLKIYKKVCKEIWDERPHVCEDCGTPIGEWSMELGENVPKWHNFAHIGDRRTPETCYDKKNIKLKCFQCHTKQDMGLNEKETWLK